MSEYVRELKKQIAAKVAGIKFQDRGPTSFALLKDNEVKALVRDEGDYVVVSVGGKDYKYDKWYTKPQHLAETLAIYLGAKGK
ncbi:MAG: hypothetical protein ABWK00_00855 [Desulfurococcaceae archaeon]